LCKKYGFPLESHISVLAVDGFQTYDMFFGRTNFWNNANVRFAKNAVQKDVLNLQEGMCVPYFINAVDGTSAAASAKQKEMNVVAPDSARIALDIIVGCSGKLVSVTFVADGSTTNNEKMIEIAKRRASQVKYPVMKEQYKQRLIINFRIAR
jgi:hypothetical protein